MAYFLDTRAVNPMRLSQVGCVGPVGPCGNYQYAQNLATPLCGQLSTPGTPACAPLCAPACGQQQFGFQQQSACGFQQQSACGFQQQSVCGQQQFFPQQQQQFVAQQQFIPQQQCGFQQQAALCCAQPVQQQICAPQCCVRAAAPTVSCATQVIAGTVPACLPSCAPICAPLPPPCPQVLEYATVTRNCNRCDCGCGRWPATPHIASIGPCGEVTVGAFNTWNNGINGECCKPCRRWR